MKRCAIDVSPGAAFALALMLVLLRPRELAALALPILAHELGHGLALLALGQRLCGFQAELGGFRLCYEGDAGPMGRALIAGAGPAAGLLYALAAARLASAGTLWEAELSAGLSLALSGMNLLPIRGLDGGEILRCTVQAVAGTERGERICAWASGLSVLLVFGLGLCLFLQGSGGGLLLAGFWMLLSELREGRGAAFTALPAAKQAPRRARR